tara:strand:- start:34 stop:375 length:342 start_codon:yes stop_codon:yes gene_type:complete
MKKNFRIIKLKNRKTLNDRYIHLHILENFEKLNFTPKRIYFHDYKKNHTIKNKSNHSDTIYIPLNGILNFFIGKKKIILKKNQSLLIKRKVIFDLRSSKSFFVVLANKIYNKR